METCEKSLEVITPRRHRLRWPKRIGCGLLILLSFGVGAWGWRHHSAQLRLNELLAELDRTEPGWRLEDLEAERAEVPEEENSARIVVMAAQNMPRSWPPEDFSEDHFWFQPSNEMLSGEDYVLLVSELANARSASDIASKLADMPRGRHRPSYTRDAIFPRFPRNQLNSRRIVTLLVYESLQWNQRGESRTALTACRAAFNAARSLGDGPSQFEQLIRCAGIEYACWAIERTLGQGEPASEDMESLQKLIEDEDAFPDQLIAARGQRAAEHRVFEGVELGEVSLNELTTKRMGWLERTIPSLWYMDTREDHALYLSLMTRRIKDVQQPLHEHTAREKEFEQLVRALPEKAFITRLMLPAVPTANERFRCKHAYLRSTIVALAAERFRREKNVWPDNIDQLCPQYLATVPLDPFDGKPLRYRRVQDGALAYSVGQGGVENGRNLDRQQPAQPGANIDFLLWDVSKRRQPPKPKSRKEEEPR